MPITKRTAKATGIAPQATQRRRAKSRRRGCGRSVVSASIKASGPPVGMGQLWLSLARGARSSPPLTSRTWERAARPLHRGARRRTTGAGCGDGRRCGGDSWFGSAGCGALARTSIGSEQFLEIAEVPRSAGGTLVAKESVAADERDIDGPITTADHAATGVFEGDTVDRQERSLPEIRRPPRRHAAARH